MVNNHYKPDGKQSYITYKPDGKQSWISYESVAEQP